LKAKLTAAMPRLATIRGAMIWWAEMPAAFMLTTSLCWFNVVRVISVPRSTAKGRKRAISCGTRSET
jgi:hypothetical protein